MSNDTTTGQPCDHPLPPTDPSERADWFAVMIRTHTVAKCPHCQLLRVWTPKAEVNA